MVDVVGVDIHYADNNFKRKNLSTHNSKKSWGYVKRLVQKKIFQEAAELEAEEGTVELQYSNRGVGGRYKWAVRGCDVYHPGTAAIVDQCHSVYNAVLISPDSWLDSQLQKTYYSRRNQPEEENDEQETSP